MTGKERDEHESLCPRCGEDAEWSYLDPEKTRVAVMCATCGRHEMSREELNQALEEIETTEDQQRTPG